MMTEEFRSNPLRLLQWQWKNAVFYTVAGAAAWALIVPLGLDFLQLPVMPITIIGAAIGIFTSFRANQAYDRWWEGRKLWGRMINSSRHFADQCLAYIGAKDPQATDALVRRHVAYVHALRTLLRKQDPFADEDFLRAIAIEPEADLPALQRSTNLTHALQNRQMRQLAALADAGVIDGHHLESLDETAMDLLNIQGGCERIKGTPLPRGYGYIANLLVQLFSIMLPFSLVHELGMMAIPLNVLVSLAFALIGEAGRVLEDPFSLYYNGLPLMALSRKIERNLLEQLGETELPPPVEANALGVLM